MGQQNMKQPLSVQVTGRGAEVFHVQGSFLLHDFIQWKYLVLNLLYPGMM